MKKKSKAAPTQPIVVDSDEEGTLSDGAEGDVDEDLETPKASQLNARPKRNTGDVKAKAESKGKRKAGNLKTELGGEIGSSSVDDVFAANQAGPPEKENVAFIPSSDFTVENKDKWAGSFVEASKTHLFVKCAFFSLPSDMLF